MSKAKTAVATSDATATKDDKPTFATATNLQLATWAVKEIGEDARKASVIELLKATYPKEKLSENSIGQVVAKAREACGFGALRATGSKATRVLDDEDTVTGDDIMKAKKFCDELQQTPEELLKLVGRIASFGSVDKLEDALHFLINLRK